MQDVSGMVKNMIILDLERGNFDLYISSFTLSAEDLSVIQLDEGEGIIVGSSYYDVPCKMTMVVDRLGYTKSGAVRCSGIRQEIDGWDVWQNHAYPNQYYRNLCISRGAEQVYVAGGMPPLVQHDEIAIPDFSMSGTNWFIMPYSVWLEIEEARERERERKAS